MIPGPIDITAVTPKSLVPGLAAPVPAATNSGSIQPVSFEPAGSFQSLLQELEIPVDKPEDTGVLAAIQATTVEEVVAPMPDSASVPLPASVLPTDSSLAQGAQAPPVQVPFFVPDAALIQISTPIAMVSTCDVMVGKESALTRNDAQSDANAMVDSGPAALRSKELVSAAPDSVSNSILQIGAERLVSSEGCKDQASSTVPTSTTLASLPAPRNAKLLADQVESLAIPPASLPTLADTKPDSTLPRLVIPVGTAAWRHELVTHINLMIDRGEQAATLRLTPDHLGPLEIRIAVREGETSLWFGATHAETREALEMALPRLREQFAGAGLALGQSTISQGSPQDPRNLRNAMLRGAPDRAFGGSDSNELAVDRISVALGLIDTYA